MHYDDTNYDSPHNADDRGAEAASGADSGTRYGRAHGRHYRGRRHRRSRANWSAMNIAGVAVGFMLLPPIGLAMLFWVMTGREVTALPRAVREMWDRFSEGRQGFDFVPRSGNCVFDEYQRTQLEKIREIRDEMGQRARHFHDWRDDAKRRADEEEFQRFMAQQGRGEESSGA